MVSLNQAPGRGTRAHSQAMIRMGEEQGRAAISVCLQASVTARSFFRMENPG